MKLGSSSIKFRKTDLNFFNFNQALYLPIRQVRVGNLGFFLVQRFSYLGILDNPL